MTDPMERLKHPFAAYPMVEEAQATGRVAAVYADAANQLSFVPSLLKTLAVCPPYLVLAWEQAKPMLDQRAFAEAAEAVIAAARTGAPPAVGADAAEILREFAGPLARMVLLGCGLHAALSGAVSGQAAVGDAPPSPGSPLPDAAPSPFENTDLESYGRVRAALDTPIVNTVWRKLSVSGKLANSWPTIEEAARRTRPHATDLQGAAYDIAMRLPWSPVASGAALRGVDMEDAAAGMTAILDAYIKTLPRALVLVADL